MRILLVMFFLIAFLILTLPFLGIEWILSRLGITDTELTTLRVVQWAFSMIIRIAGVRLNVIGQENIPKDEPVLYVGNHRSYFDIVITYALCPGKTGYIAKDGLNKFPVLNIYMRRIHCLFLVRDDLKQGLKVILSAIDYIKQGISICVFPEGTRNKDFAHPEAIAPFKEGSFKIATKTGCKIVPFAILGSDQLFEAHFPWIKPGKVTLVYGEPIDPKALDKEQQKHIGAYTQEIVQKMLNKQIAAQQ